MASSPIPSHTAQVCATSSSPSSGLAEAVVPTEAWSLGRFVGPNLPATEAMAPASSSTPEPNYGWRKACIPFHAQSLSLFPQVIDDMGYLHYQRTHTPEEVAARRAMGRPRQTTLVGGLVNKRTASADEAWDIG